jgi:predicted permease
MFKSPLLWAIGAGFLIRVTGISLPQPILTTMEFGGNAAPPLAAFVLGGTLHNDKLTVNRHILAGVFIRLVGGFAFALLATRIFGITGVARTVLIVGSTLPSAVFTSVLPLRYGIRSEYAGPIVMLSTILGVITIPIAFILVT